MTKKEIVRSIAEELGESQDLTAKIVQKTFDAIIEALVRDRKIELRNFGVFEVKDRAARMARNPTTGEAVPIPRRCVATFKPGKVMEAKVSQLEPMVDDPKGTKPERSGNDPNDVPVDELDQSGRWDVDQD